MQQMSTLERVLLRAFVLAIVLVVLATFGLLTYGAPPLY
jgi:hypothetical protein